MQKPIILLFFLFTSILLRAENLPELNLQIGKKYLIETIYHEEATEGTNRTVYDKKRFEFEATDFNQKELTYDITLVLKYFMHVVQEKNYGEWSEKEVYETGGLSTYRNAIVYLNMYQVPVKFKLTKHGKIISFTTIDFGKNKSPEGFSMNMGDWDQKRFIEEISAIFFDPEKTESFWDHKMDVRANFRIIHEDETKLEIEVPNNEEINQKASEKSLYGQHQRNVLMDRTSGLILQDKLSFVWKFIGEKQITRYQKLIPEFSQKFEVMQKTGVSFYAKTEILNPNTSVRILVQDSTEYEKFIYLSYWDQASYSVKSFRLEKDKSGIFNFSFNITDPQKIYFQFNSRTMDMSEDQGIFLIPGDNIELEIQKITQPNRLIFKGIGADENKAWLAIQQVVRNKKPLTRSGIEGSFGHYKDSVFRILNQEKSNLNPDFYVDLVNTLTYSDYTTKLDLTDSIKDYEIPIYNTLARRNPAYLRFLNRYLYSFMKKNRRLSTNYTYNTFDETIYSLANVLFPEPVLGEFLTREVEHELQFGKWESAKMHFERLKLTYSNRPQFKTTEHIYQSQSMLSPGKPFPFETLTDVNGNKLNLSKIKNKLVVIRIKDLRINLMNGMEFRREAWNDYSDFRKDILLIQLIVGTKEQFTRIKPSLDNKTDERYIFMDIEDLFWGEHPAMPLLSKNTIILGKDGTILFNRKPDGNELVNAIEDAKKPRLLNHESAQLLKIVVFTLMGILILAGFAFISYRRISMLKFRQEEQKRRMRELELTVIRTQMNPHFMFNCLNSIQNLVQKNKNEEAHLYISKFASLVRQALNNSKKDEISLSKELDSVREYIELEQLRFDFVFKLNIENELDLSNIFVPPMLLQPFVENAILHGLITKKTDRLLEIRMHKIQNRIELIVEDNGIGREAAAKSEGKGHGQGILLSKNRLELLTEKTGIHYDLKIEDLMDENQNPCGTRITIEFIEEE